MTNRQRIFIKAVEAISALVKAPDKGMTARTSLPMELHSKAKRWLLDNNLEPHDDGDVPV